MTSPAPNQGFCCCLIFLSLQYQASVPTCGVDPKSNQSSVVTFITVITFNSKSLLQTLGAGLPSTVGTQQPFHCSLPCRSSTGRNNLFFSRILEGQGYKGFVKIHDGRKNCTCQGRLSHAAHKSYKISSRQIKYYYRFKNKMHN